MICCLTNVRKICKPNPVEALCSCLLVTTKVASMEDVLFDDQLDVVA